MAVFLIRCDASAAIGVGHFMRCSTLAEELIRRGHRVCFAMREMTPFVQGRLAESGFEVLVVGDAELEQMSRWVRQHAAAWVLLDHYQITEPYFSSLKQLGVRVGVVDDMADRDLSAVDWVLNQNAGAETLTYRVRENCVRLFGPRYGLLRSQFLQQRSRLRRTFATTDNHVLITFGGGDCMTWNDAILHGLQAVSRPLHIRLVGSASAVKSSRHNIEILHNVANMADLMAWADVSVNAGGSTCWELCCLGVPMLVLVLSQDQRLVADALTANDCATTICERDLANGDVVEELLSAPEQRNTLSTAARSLVDGQGAARVAKSLENLG